MSDLPPPSSQQVHEPPFFHHPNGQRVKIFVEAGGIVNRPRLIRKLKKHDANICTDPKNAQVILVDANSWQGKEFIREWGQDQNKVVLSYAWVTASENAGRPLLADDGWGACLTKDDGLPILKPTGMDDDREIETTSLLPTPRETPVELDRAQPRRANPSETGSEKAYKYTHFTQGNIAASPHMDSYEGPVAQPLSQSQSHLLQRQQQSHSPSMPSPSTTDSASMFPSNMPFGPPNSAINPFNMTMNMMPLPNNMFSIFAQQQQQHPPAVSSPMIPPASSMMPNMPEHFATALMDVMRMYPGGMPTSQWPTFPGAPPQQNSQILPQQTAGSSTSGTIVREGSSGTSLGRRNTESPDLPIMSYRPPTFSKRKRKSNGSLFNSTDDDGEDEVPLASMEKKKKTSVSKHLAEREERTARRTSLSFSAPGRNPHSKSSTSAPPSSAGSLFVNRDGKPMQFYVQVDLKGRGEVVRAIKKNGGTVTAGIGIADYAVLWSKSTTFKELLGNASATQTPAVTYHFILDAVSEGSIPENLENYLFDSKQEVKAKRVPQNPATAERRRIMKNARQAEKRARDRDLEYNFIARSKPQKTSTPSTSTIGMPSVKSMVQASKGAQEPKRSTATSVAEKPKISPTSKPTPASSSSPTKTVKKKSTYYPKEQTPPLPSKSEQHKSGGYSYTSDERDWMEKYAFILFKRDPFMNRTEVSNAFHKKLPHHPPRSIANLLGSTLDEQYNIAKKKGGIAHRKEKSKWEQEQQNEQQKRETEKDDKKGEQYQQHVEQVAEDVKELGREQGVEDAMEIVKESHREDSEGTLPVPDPMDIDETTHPTAVPAEPPQEEKHGTSLTSVEEEDIRAFLQVFASCDDPEQSEEQFFKKLERVAACKSAPTWREFNTRHEQQIMDRYSKQIDTKHGTEEL